MMKCRSLKAAPWHIWPQMNMTIFQILKRQIKKVKLQTFSAANSKTRVEILSAILLYSKMIFSGDHTPVRKVLLQDTKI